MPKTALIIVDMQRDFMPGGALPVPGADEIVPTLNRYIQLAKGRGWPVVATRDWHPPNHCSFREQGGPWPAHCLAGTEGAEFHPDLELPEDAIVISKATDPDREAYSAFQGTDLLKKLKQLGIERLLIGGVATDYCVNETVRDGVQEGFEVWLLSDATRGTDPEAVAEILKGLEKMGVRLATFEQVEALKE